MPETLIAASELDDKGLDIGPLLYDHSIREAKCHPITRFAVSDLRFLIGFPRAEATIGTQSKIKNQNSQITL